MGGNRKARAPGFRLEIYDGSDFRKFLEIGEEWKCAIFDPWWSAPAAIYGWVGPTEGAFTIAAASIAAFDAHSGYTDSGVFAIGRLPSGEPVAGGRDRVLKYDGSRWVLLRSGLDRIRSFSVAPDGALWVASGSGVHRFKSGSWIAAAVRRRASFGAGLPGVPR